MGMDIQKLKQNLLENILNSQKLKKKRSPTGFAPKIVLIFN